MEGQGKTLLFEVVNAYGSCKFYADGVGVTRDMDVPEPHHFEWTTIDGKLARRGDPSCKWWVEGPKVQQAYQAYLNKLIVEGYTPEMRL